MSLALDDVKHFLVVAQALNMTRASERIGMSQPALSYAIKRLEKELGGDLFIRLKSGLQLTKLGEEFSKKAHKLAHTWNEAQNLTDPKSGFKGTYTFAVHPSVALYSLDLFVPQIAKKFPELNLNFIHGLSREMTEKVINWEADFGLVVNPVQHLDLVIIPLCQDEVTIFYSNGADKKLIFDQDLFQSQSILNELENKGRYKGVINSKNLEVVATLAQSGVGHGLLPTRVARKYSGLKRLRGAPRFKDEICLIYRAEKQKNVAGQSIVNIIKSAKL